MLHQSEMLYNTHTHPLTAIEMLDLMHFYQVTGSIIGGMSSTTFLVCIVINSFNVTNWNVVITILWSFFLLLIMLFYELDSTSQKGFYRPIFYVLHMYLYIIYRELNDLLAEEKARKRKAQSNRSTRYLCLSVCVYYRYCMCSTCWYFKSLMLHCIGINLMVSFLIPPFSLTQRIFCTSIG